MPNPPVLAEAVAHSARGWAGDIPAGMEMNHFMVYISSLLETAQQQQMRAWQQQLQQTRLLQQLQTSMQQQREVTFSEGERKDQEPRTPVPETVVPELAQTPQAATIPAGGLLSPFSRQDVPEFEQKLQMKSMVNVATGSDDTPSEIKALALVPPALPITDECPAQQENCFQAKVFHESVLRRKVDQTEAASHDIHTQLDKLDKVNARKSMSNIRSDWHRNMRQTVRGYRWELSFGLLVIFNTLCSSLELQYVGMKTGYNLGYPFSRTVPDWGEGAFTVINDLFLVIFSLEIFIKLVVLRSSFWYVIWDVIDFIVVFLGIALRILEDLIDVGIDPMMLRLVRLIKLIRFLKMFKLAGSLHSMNLILKSVMATKGTLFWSMTLLSMVQWIAGMFVAQMTQQFMADETKDREARWAVYRYYGTFLKTQFTMFEITHVNYAMAARVLVDNISEWWCWFFVAYRCLVAFAFLQVIRSVFIQMTLKVAERDKDLVIHNKRLALQELHAKLGDIFNLLELDGDGAMSFNEFVHQLKQESTKIWLNALDIDVSDPEGLFELLDLKGNGEVSKQEFTYGAAQLRGSAQSRDLFHVQTLVERMEAKLDTLLPGQFRGKVFPVDINLQRKSEEES